MASSSCRLTVSLLFVLAMCTAAFADGSHDRTQVGHDIVVNSGEEVSDVTCFGCSVRIRGHVQGDATAFGGSVTIEEGGEISGDVTTFAGGVRLSRDAKVSGDVTSFGGRVRRDSAASVGGDVSSFGSALWLLAIFGLPFIVLGGLIALLVWIVKRFTRRAVPVAV